MAKKITVVEKKTDWKKTKVGKRSQTVKTSNTWIKVKGKKRTKIVNIEVWEKKNAKKD